MKQKNPLYVVKGSTVLEAKGMLDLFLKKFNLEPVMKLFFNLVSMLFNEVKNYPMLVAVKAIIDEWMGKLATLFARFGLA
jgi:hypothetical protein